MKAVLVLVFAFLICPFSAFAEGGCPPGSYPIGGQGVQGCAPIPQGGGAAADGPRATGKWETRWGAIAEDPISMATGASVSMKSKRKAVDAATAECKRMGGRNCKVRLAYFNQCAAIADATAQSLASGPGASVASRAETAPKAEALALKDCSSAGNGQQCEISYSACSLSEFKAF